MLPSPHHAVMVHNVVHLLGVRHPDITQHCFKLTVRLRRATQGPLADNVNQDQTTRNRQYDLGSILSDKEIFVFLVLKIVKFNLSIRIKVAQSSTHKNLCLH